MKMLQLMYDLSYWFDFGVRTVVNHPLVAIIPAFVGFVCYQVLSTLKFIGAIISFGVAAVLGILLEWLMF